MRSLRLTLLLVSAHAVLLLGLRAPLAAQTQPKAVQKAADGTNALTESLTLPAGKTLTLTGTVAGTPAGGTLNLTGLTLTLASPTLTGFTASGQTVFNAQWNSNVFQHDDTSGTTHAGITIVNTANPGNNIGEGTVSFQGYNASGVAKQYGAMGVQLSSVTPGSENAGIFFHANYNGLDASITDVGILGNNGIFLFGGPYNKTTGPGSGVLAVNGSVSVKQLLRLESTASVSGDLVAGGIINAESGYGLNLSPDHGGTNGVKLVAAYYNGAAYKSILEYANTTASAVSTLYLGKNGELVNMAGSAVVSGLYSANQGILKLSSTNNESTGISFFVGNGSPSANARQWQIATNTSAFGTLEFLTSTTSTGNPTTLAMKLNATNLTVVGNAAIGGTTASTGAITGPSITLTGNAAIGGTTASTGAITGPSITLTGNATIGGTTASTGAITGPSITLTGNATIGGTTASTGAITGPSITISGNSFFSGLSTYTRVGGSPSIAGTADFALDGSSSSGELYLNQYSSGNVYIAGGGGATTVSGVLTSTGGLVTSVVGKTLSVKSGTNSLAGTVTLSAGAGTISSTAIDANTVLVITLKTISGTVGGQPYVSAITAGTSATLAGGGASNNSVYNWVALKVN
ncbi:MAG: hypothetical protein RLZZ15_589 [Verrucomicrobiota bacterium]|jgi:hypothetical protein